MKMSKRMNIITWLLLATVIIAGGIFALITKPSTSHAAGPTPVTNNVFSAPPNCTWYAWQRMHDQLGVDLQFHSGDNGYAYNWVNVLQSRQPYAAWSEKIGWVQVQFNTSPAVGDIAFVPKADGKYAYSSFGHVAYVEQLLGNGNFIVTGQDFSPPVGTHSSLWNLQDVQSHQHGAARFIHIIFSSPVTTHNPVAIKNHNGRMEVFQVGNSGQLYFQSQNSNGGWQGWHSLGGSWPGQPVVNVNADGRLEIFIVGNQGSTGGGLFHAWQTRAGDDTSWTGWQMLAGAWPAGNPAVALNNANELEVFMRGLNGNLYHEWQVSASNSGSYVGWNPMGGYWTTDPVVARNAGGSLLVFMVGTSTELYFSQRLRGGWSGWQSLGGSWPGQPAVILNASHKLEVFIVGNQGSAGGGLFHAWQISPESTSWTRWYMLPGAWHAGTPFVGRNSNGTMDVFLVGQGANPNNTALFHDYENPNTSWSGPQSLGGYWPGEASAAINLSGGLEAFMLGNSGEVYHMWENNAGYSASYSGWYTLGVPQ